MGRRQTSKTEAPIRGVTVRTTAAGTQTLQIGYTFKGKRYRHSMNVPPTPNNIKAANRKLEQIRLEIQMGTFDVGNHFEQPQGSHPADQRLTDLVLAYMKRKHQLKGKKGWVETTYSERVKQFRLHIEPAFKGVTLGELSPKHLRDWLQDKEFSLSYGSVLLSLVNPVIKQAVSDGIIPRNPWEGVAVSDYLHQSTTQERKERINPLDEEEIHRLLSVIDKPGLKNYVQFMLFSGLRLQEGPVLRWDDIDWALNTVLVRRAVGHAFNKEILKTTKTDEHRYVELLTPAREALEAQKELRMDKNPYVFPPMYNMAKSQYDWMPRTYIRSFWKRYLQKAGIDTQHRSPKQTRHTFCSLMISAGKPLTWVIQQTGHSSLSMLEKHYAKAVRLAASTHQDYDFNQALTRARQRKDAQ